MQEPEEIVVFSLGLTPTGHVAVVLDDAPSADLPPRAASRIRAAFERGRGHGLFHLGAVETQGELGPAISFWRDLAKLYLTKLCAHVDIDQAVKEGLPVNFPDDEASAMLASAPPFRGAEYLSREALDGAWREIGQAFLDEVKASGLGAQEMLKQRNELWNMVGRVFFHLAENKARPDVPFAFLATYTTRISSQGKLQHVPLGRAVQEQAIGGDRKLLLSLLLPVQRAASQSTLLRELVDSGKIFQTQAWKPSEAYRFLKEVPLLEDKGVHVRLPDWWKRGQPPRLQVSVTMGSESAVGVGVEAMLDFSVGLAMDGEPVSKAEWKEILAQNDGLALVKGRWVEVDRKKLEGLLEHWKQVEQAAREDGVTFLKAVRLLAGAPGSSSTFDPTGAEPASRDEWLSVNAGPWLREALESLRKPEAALELAPGAELTADLRPYQRDGVKWLWLLRKLGLGGCLADDMGLGKTVQVIAILVLLRRERARASASRPSILVLPASLIGNWKSELEKFAPAVKFFVAHPSEVPTGEIPTAIEERFHDFDVVLTTYGFIHRQAWAREKQWDLVVLDEAQAIKNPGTNQAKAVKELRCRQRVVLTGTPIENRVGDLWSLFDFLNPGLLGSAKEFSRFAGTAGKGGRDVFGTIRSLVRPYILRRLKTDRRIIRDLPDKTEVKVHCGLEKTQAVLYQKTVDDLAKSLGGLDRKDGIRRRGIVLSFLLRLKQICNHPSQWTGDGVYAPEHSGKMLRLREISDEISSRQEKVLVFTQFQEITRPLEEFLRGVFRRSGLVLDGTTPVKARKGLVDDFQAEQGPPFFVLSVKAGGTGLNLTAASHVVHFDRWWNPAVENQATDRAFRIGQKRNVLVHKFVCRGTVEEKIDEMLTAKQGLSDEILKGGAESSLTEMGDEELIQFVSLDFNRATVES